MELCPPPTPWVQEQFDKEHSEWLATVHVQPHDLPKGLEVTTSAVTPSAVSVVEQLQFFELQSAVEAGSHAQPHDFSNGLCVMASATRPFGVSVEAQEQLRAEQETVLTGVHAHPQSLFQGELVLDNPLSEHEQLEATQFTVTFAPESSKMT